MAIVRHVLFAALFAVSVLHASELQVNQSWELTWQPKKMFPSRYDNKVVLAGGTDEYSNYLGLQQIDLETGDHQWGTWGWSTQQSSNKWVERGPRYSYTSLTSGVYALKFKDNDVNTVWSWAGFNNAYPPTYNSNPNYNELYWVDFNGDFYAVDATTGASRWNVTGQKLFGKPFVSHEGNQIYVALDNNRGLAYIDMQSVEYTWTQFAPYLHGAFMFVAEDDGDIFVQTYNQTTSAWGVARVNGDFGVLNWHIEGMVKPSWTVDPQFNTIIFAKGFDVWCYNGTGVTRLHQIDGSFSSFAPGNSSQYVGGFMTWPNTDGILSYLYDSSNSNYGTFFNQYNSDGVFTGKVTLPKANNMYVFAPTKGKNYYSVLTDDWGDHDDGCVVTVAPPS